MKIFAEAFILVNLLLWISSCASYGSLQDYQSRLASNVAISLPLKDLSYVMLPFDEYVKDELGGEGALTYQFEGDAKTFYLAYELPKTPAERILEFTSVFSSFAGVCSCCLSIISNTQ